jgi:EMC6
MMPDPMGEQEGADGNAAPSFDNEKEFFDPLLLQFNVAKLERIQSVWGIAAGCITGICGLNGIRGFGTYVFCCCHEDATMIICRSTLPVKQCTSSDPLDKVFVTKNLLFLVSQSAFSCGT